MTLADLVAGTTVFVDANILVFALANHPTHGAACDAFLVWLAGPGHRQSPSPASR